jgi:uncharacterized membrane protein
MDQAVWNTLHGRWFAFTIWEGGTTRLAAHVEPILLVIAQFYRLYSSPKTLLALQAATISLGALPAFWLARQRLGNDFSGAVFAFAYLLTPSLEAAALADFHPVTLSASLLLFAFYFMQKRWYLPFLFFALLAMATKEEIPLAILLMGLYIAFIQRDRGWGLFTAFLSLAWFGTAFGLVIPYFNPAAASPYLSRYQHLTEAANLAPSLSGLPGRAIATLMEEARREYLHALLRPLLYLPLLSPFTLLLALPDLGINLLSSFPWQYSSQAHYDAPIVPFLIVSAIFGVQYIGRLLGKLAKPLSAVAIYLLTMAILGSSLYSYYNSVFLPLSDRLPTVSEHNRLAEVFINMIPQDAALSASSTLIPHVSQRQRLYLFPRLEDAQYIFLDVSASPHPIDVPSQHKKVQDLLKSGEWGIVAADDGYLLLKKREGTDTLPDQFFDFARARQPEIPFPVEAAFGPLRLLGYDIQPRGPIHGKNAYATLTLYWQAAERTKKDYRLAVFVVSESETVTSSLTYHAATTWYPTSRWRPGEVVKVVVPRVSLGGHSKGRLQIGVIDGTDENDPAQRIRPTAWNGPVLLRLNGDRTLLELRTLEAGGGIGPASR